MALMTAGVPISNPVSGVAMGLVKKGDDYTILTDIQGMEDHLGDMDFKVAGTKNGICALQMDIKIDGITKEILQEALAQAKVGRAQIMDCMLGAIPAPRDHLSKYAPKMHVMHIDPEQIRDVIGRGGETINEIIEKSNDVKIDIDQDGTVVIYHSDQEAIDTAVSLIERIVKKAEVGEIYDGTIARVNDNYAFVTLFEGTDGFLHISDWSYERTSKMQDRNSHLITSSQKSWDKFLIKLSFLKSASGQNLRRNIIQKIIGSYLRRAYLSMLRQFGMPI